MMQTGKRHFVKTLAAVSFGLFLTIGAGHAAASETGHHPHWGYSGENGPGHWAKEHPACAGKSQSPIDIAGAEEADAPAIEFSYKPTRINVLNNGHTVQVNYDAGSSIKVDGVEYKLVQFHFHDPSEHTVGGKSFGTELHLVHKNDKGKLAVVGVLIDKGAENPAFKTLWANLPKKAEEKKELKDTLNAEEMLPKERAYYRYSGSLTTPPCSEEVTWLVLKAPIQMSEAQINAFKAVIEGNNRPVQPANGRKIITGKTK